jgi:hypothetical protein
VAFRLFHSKELLAPSPTLLLEDRPLQAVRACLFNIFVAMEPGQLSQYSDGLRARRPGFNSW